MGDLLPYRGIMPTLGANVFVAPGAVVIGDVTLGDRASVWFGCVLRGDVNHIRIGAGSNIQDRTVIHVSRRTFPTEIGANVTVGHACLLHGCIIEDGGFVGMGATVMDGVVIESGAMVAAGALVTPGKTVRAGEMWGGRPAKLLRPLTPEDQTRFFASAAHYADLAKEYCDAFTGSSL